MSKGMPIIKWPWENRPPQDVRRVTIRKECDVWTGPASANTYSRGETVGLAPAVAEKLIARGLAVPEGCPLDPPPPDQTPTRVRFVQPWVIDSVQFNPPETASVPAFQAARLITRGVAVPDDGQFVATPEEMASAATTARVRRRLHDQAAAVLAGWK